MSAEYFQFRPRSTYGRGFLRDFVGALLQHDLVEFTVDSEGTPPEKVVVVKVFNGGDELDD